MRMLVVGAGSIGGLFGGRLAQAGRDVTFLVRPSRAEQLRREGLRIVSPLGDATVVPKLLVSKDIHDAFDVVFLSVKAYSLESAIGDFAPAVSDQTMILPILNGMKHMDTLAAHFGARAVLGGACKAATMLDKQGRIVQLTKLQDLAYGEMDGSRSERVTRLHEFMQGAGFEARISQSIVLEMWQKWTLLATLGGVTCLMRGNTGEIEGAHGGREFLTKFFNEVVSIVEAVGTPLGEAFIAATAELLLKPGAPTTSSLYRDLQEGNAVEADQILGDLLLRAAKAGLSAPLISAAYTHLCVYQNRVAATRSASNPGRLRV
jgi:2-dehydropantoate 2-reductase